ncbi:uncharacterized protein BHQ10_008467 [Talaromyces amestolkiae]|uniref:Uncharacterized protein n=1 Tax=Talaromyces amestolkiae TaxID=1196081 RepID=A0A364L9F7_TALAM|nr:uncharacterized protein BHQ10_008467 [Talaromyces amestolkiae]RAO72455.1 hypothetical protein BHQ10_008467 [Talaromyces amestolkiae]
MESRQEFPLESLSNRPASLVSPVSSMHEDHRVPESQPEQDTHQHEEVPSYEERHNTQDVPPSYQRRDPAITTVLRANFFIWIPTAIYVVIVVWSWAMICIIAREPPLTFNKDLRTRQYYAARVLQSVASVATIPIISAVCACAVAIYVQNQRNEHSLSLRQVMALADREWMNPLCLIAPLSKRFGSGFLYLAIFIYSIGAITYPIQWLFLHAEEKPVNPVSITSHDVLRISPLAGQITGHYKKGWAIRALQKQLEAGYLAGKQAQLWGSFSTIQDYDSRNSWFTELPNNYNTGTYRSIAPRYNSSTSSELIPVDEFPSNCSSTPDYFYTSLNYTESSGDRDPYDEPIDPAQIQVCMPANMTGSPWSASNARQEITETLFIHINTSYLALLDGNGILNNTYKITMTTTAGWFELPNLWNKGVPGPIIENPNVTCETSAGCIDAADPAMAASATIYDTIYKRSAVDELGNELIDSTDLLGPLGTVAVALFGPGSWFDNQQLLFPDFTNHNDTGWVYYLDEIVNIYENFPLVSLAETAYVGYGTGIRLYEWLRFFIVEGHNTTLPGALTLASFYAVQALLQTNEDQYVYLNEVSKDNFETVMMPSISLAGIIVVSVLMALYLIPLLAFAAYAGLSKSWTVRLDSFVMLRMGAAIGQKDLPMQVGKSLGEIGALDQLPGVVRDVSAPDDKIRQIALGFGGTRLRPKAKYPAYPGNQHDSRDMRWY